MRPQRNEERYSRQKDIVPAERIDACKATVIGVTRATMHLFNDACRSSQRITEHEADLVRASLERLIRVCRGETKSTIAPPGDAVPPSALNYIHRDADDKLLACLENEYFTAAIVGPPDSGKTTLAQVLRIAAMERGIHALYFDCKVVAKRTIEYEQRAEQHVSHGRQEDICVQQDHFAAELASILVAAWDLKSALQKLHAFPTWLYRQLRAKEHRRRLLILDGVVSLNPIVFEGVPVHKYPSKTIVSRVSTSSSAPSHPLSPLPICLMPPNDRV